MKVPFIDLNRAYKLYGKEIENAVIEVLKSSRYLNGEKTKEIEEKLAKFLGVNYAIGTSSGTEALYLILKSLELPPNSFVLLPSFTFIATSEVVVRAGLIPYFVDVEEDTYNISLKALKSAYYSLIKAGKKVSAVIAVSIFGIPADLEEISAFCKENNLVLIEDICQAFGAEINGKKVGTFGIASATSFYPSKPLSTCGDAGMVFTNEEEIAKKVRILKEHGQTKAYYYEYNGVNGRIDEIHSAILLVKFSYFEKELALRQKKAEYYFQLLKDIPEISLFKIKKNYLPSYSLFTVKAKKRDQLKEYLEKHGIYTGIYYPLPLHLQPVYKHLNFTNGMLPVTEKLSKEVISLPFFPYIEEKEIEYVVEKIKNFYEGK